MKKNETPKKSSAKKTPPKKTPIKKDSPKSNGKAKTKKASPVKSNIFVKTEVESPSKVEVESPSKVKVEKEEKNDSAEESPKEKSPKKEEKPKNHPFFTKQKDMKLQSVEETSNGSSYDPGKSNYHPIKDCFWKHGEKYVTLSTFLF